MGVIFQSELFESFGAGYSDLGHYWYLQISPVPITFIYEP